MINLIRLIYLYVKYQTGQTDHVYIDDAFTKPDNEHYFYFKVLTDCTVTYTNKFGFDDAVDLLAGDEVFGFITAISVSAGGYLRAYKV